MCSLAIYLDQDNTAVSLLQPRCKEQLTNCLHEIWSRMKRYYFSSLVLSLSKMKLKKRIGAHDDDEKFAAKEALQKKIGVQKF